MRRNCKNTTTAFLRLALAGLVSLGASGVSIASEPPQPTFLESGDNDLIRFQMGGAPEQENFGQSFAAPEQTAVPAMEPAPAQGGLNARQRAGIAAGRQRASTTQPPASQEKAREARNPVPSAKPETAMADQGPQDAPASTQLHYGIAPRMEEAEAPDLEDRKAQIQKLSAGTSFAQPPPEPALDDAISARLVTVCLNNPDTASGAKAFDIRKDGPPRYIADIGATSCARFEPTRHTLFFWKTNDLGALSLILSNRLDLNDADGTQVSVDWIRDR